MSSWNNRQTINSVSHISLYVLLTGCKNVAKYVNELKDKIILCGQQPFSGWTKLFNSFQTRDFRRRKLKTIIENQIILNNILQLSI